MKQYDSYKDSGVQWIGKIPSHWEICRFKDLTNLQTLASMSDTKIGLENIEGKTGKFIETDSEFEGNGIAFEQGDIVYGKLRPYLQKVWLATFSGNAVGDFFVFRTKCNCHNRYLFYVMLSDGFTSMCNGATFGAKMPRVSSDFIRSLHFFIPPFAEQQAIATYLDKKCDKIDMAIATQQKRIDMLGELRQNIITHAVTRGINPDAALKDSGVEWIGEVPEHWEVMKLKRCALIKTGCTPPTKEEKYYESDDIDWFTPSDIGSDCIYEAEKKISVIAKRDGVCRLFPAKSVYFVGIGATIGKVSVCDNEASANQQINVIIPNKRANYKYLAYCLKSQKGEVYLTANTVTLPIINQERTGSLMIPVPPLEEQQQIVEHIEEQTARIDKSIAKAERQIELLQELKQSIITEVVTGKRKVFA